MNIKTKYDVGDIVFIGKAVLMVKAVDVKVGGLGPNKPYIRYSVCRPHKVESAWSSGILESLITKKASLKDWKKAGGVDRD